MRTQRGFLSNEATANTLGKSPVFETRPPARPQAAAAFTNLLLSQLKLPSTRYRIERGGLTIVSTSISSWSRGPPALRRSTRRGWGAARPGARLRCLEVPAGFATRSYYRRVVRQRPHHGAPKTGQILAMVGETYQARETPLMGISTARVRAGYVRLSHCVRPRAVTRLPDLGHPRQDQRPEPGRRSIMDRSFSAWRWQTIMGSHGATAEADGHRKRRTDRGILWHFLYSTRRRSSPSWMPLAAYGVFAQQGVYFGQEVSGDEGSSP